MPWNGKIWFPGGGIDLGESRMGALLREIQEETGLMNVQVGRLLGSYENFFYCQPTDEAMHAFLFFYECTTSDTVLKRNDQVDDGEMQDLEWIAIDQLNKEDIGDLNEEIFAMIKSLSPVAEEPPRQ